jgi:hypothetical protein
MYNSWKYKIYGEIFGLPVDNQGEILTDFPSYQKHKAREFVRSQGLIQETNLFGRLLEGVDGQYRDLLPLYTKLDRNKQFRFPTSFPSNIGISEWNHDNIPIVPIYGGYSVIVYQHDLVQMRRDKNQPPNEQKNKKVPQIDSLEMLFRFYYSSDPIYHTEYYPGIELNHFYQTNILELSTSCPIHQPCSIAASKSANIPPSSANTSPNTSQTANNPNLKSTHRTFPHLGGFHQLAPLYHKFNSLRLPLNLHLSIPHGLFGKGGLYFGPQRRGKFFQEKKLEQYGEKCPKCKKYITKQSEISQKRDDYESWSNDNNANDTRVPYVCFDIEYNHSLVCDFQSHFDQIQMLKKEHERVNYCNFIQNQNLIAQNKKKSNTNNLFSNFTTHPFDSSNNQLDNGVDYNANILEPMRLSTKLLPHPHPIYYKLDKQNSPHPQLSTPSSPSLFDLPPFSSKNQPKKHINFISELTHSTQTGEFLGDVYFSLFPFTLSENNNSTKQTLKHSGKTQRNDNNKKGSNRSRSKSQLSPLNAHNNVHNSPHSHFYPQFISNNELITVIPSELLLLPLLSSKSPISLLNLANIDESHQSEGFLSENRKGKGNGTSKGRNVANLLLSPITAQIERNSQYRPPMAIKYLYKSHTDLITRYAGLLGKKQERATQQSTFFAAFFQELTKMLFSKCKNTLVEIIPDSISSSLLQFNTCCGRFWCSDGAGMEHRCWEIGCCAAKSIKDKENGQNLHNVHNCDEKQKNFSFCNLCSSSRRRGMSTLDDDTTIDYLSRHPTGSDGFGGNAYCLCSKDDGKLPHDKQFGNNKAVQFGTNHPNTIVLPQKLYSFQLIPAMFLAPDPNHVATLLFQKLNRELILNYLSSSYIITHEVFSEFNSQNSYSFPHTIPTSTSPTCPKCYLRSMGYHSGPLCFHDHITNHDLRSISDYDKFNLRVYQLHSTLPVIENYPSGWSPDGEKGSHSRDLATDTFETVTSRMQQFDGMVVKLPQNVAIMSTNSGFSLPFIKPASTFPKRAQQISKHNHIIPNSITIDDIDIFNDLSYNNTLICRNIDSFDALDFEFEIQTSPPFPISPPRRTQHRRHVFLSHPKELPGHKRGETTSMLPNWAMDEAKHGHFSREGSTVSYSSTKMPHSLTSFMDIIHHRRAIVNTDIGTGM